MRIVRPKTVDAAAMLDSNVSETVALYNVGTPYAEDDTVREDTSTGSFLYQSLANSNLGNALTDTTKWLALGATNRWRAFDSSVTSQTENADSIEYTIQVSGRADSVSVFNVSASEIQVIAEDAIDGEVFNQTYSLVSSSGITDIYGWLTEPIERLADIFVVGLPTLYANLQVTVKVNAPGSTAKCGAIVIGLSKTIGAAQYGAQVGIKDYSVKGTDDYGNTVVIKRAFAKRANFTVWVESGFTDQLQIQLAAYRAIPIVYVGSDAFGSTLIYGFYRDFNEEIAGPNHTICTIEIEGLT